MIEPAFNQMQVQAAIDLDFAEGVRALMRQDPDIIMVGEIRDLETAEMAIQAALTGHLVLSTLHTNDARERGHAAARPRRAAVPAQRDRARRDGAAAGAHAVPALQAEGALRRRTAPTTPPGRSWSRRGRRAARAGSTSRSAASSAA